jgi:hypothetical protein
MFDFPDLFFPRILPTGAILFNFLFILVSIPLEGYILNTRLKFDKKTSIFYAIAINLFSNVIGWVTFFFIEPILPPLIKADLINYVFFNRIGSSNNIQTIIIFVAFFIFFGTFLVKYLLLRILLLSLVEPGKSEPEIPTEIRRNSRRASKIKLQNTNIVTSILIANALSYSFIVAVLFARSWNL